MLSVRRISMRRCFILPFSVFFCHPLPNTHTNRILSVCLTFTEIQIQQQPWWFCIYGSSDFSFCCWPLSFLTLKQCKQRSAQTREEESERETLAKKKQSIAKWANMHISWVIFCLSFAISFLHLLWYMRLRVTLCSMNMYNIFRCVSYGVWPRHRC